MLRWHHENGKEVVPALMYIEQLERELADLRQQVSKPGQGRGRLLRCGSCRAAAAGEVQGFWLEVDRTHYRARYAVTTSASACMSAPQLAAHKDRALPYCPSPLCVHQIEDHQAAERVASAASGGAAPLPGNELLDYLKQLSPEGTGAGVGRRLFSCTCCTMA